MLTTKPDPTPELPRYEDVLLCAPDGDQPVKAVRTIKWMETVRGTNAQGEEVVLGFLVTVPPRKSLRIYSHVCRNAETHARALALLGNDVAGKLPAVWNGHYDGCPLCELVK